MPSSAKLTRSAAAFFCLSLAIGSSLRADQFSQYFYDGQCDGRVLVPTQRGALEYLHPGPQGLRISLPGDASASGRVGIQLVAPVSGNFQVTASLEITSLSAADSPGVVLALNDTTAAGSVLSISRGAQGGAGQYFVVSGSKGAPASQTAPATKKDCSLRITREEQLIRFSVAEGDSKDFQQIFEGTGGAAEYTVQIGADPKECPGGIEARITYLKVVGATNLQPYLQQPKRGLISGGTAGGGLLWWGMCAGGAITLGAGGVWWARMRAERADQAVTPARRVTTAAPAPAAQSPPDTNRGSGERAVVKVPEPVASPRQAAATMRAPTMPASRPARPQPAAAAEPSRSPVSEQATSRARPGSDPAREVVSMPRPVVAPKEPAPTPPVTKSEQVSASSQPVTWDEEALRTLESKARDFLKVNPAAVSYGERHRFRFHFHNGNLHGAFVAWWESDVEAIKAMGIRGKEIEDRLKKKFEGHYENGERRGKFTYWDKSGRSIVQHAEDVGGVPTAPHAPEVAESAVGPESSSTAAGAEPCAVPWDEAALLDLEKKAHEFLKVNPGAVSYGERHHFRFRFQDGKLHGAFAAWWKADIEAIKAMGVKGKEIEDRLPKKFEGNYVDGQRQGTFSYWDQQGQRGDMAYENGQGSPVPPPAVEAPAAVEPAAPPEPPLPAWNEAALGELEEKARHFLDDNPQVQTYVERHRFRFNVADGKLHGPFVVWRSVDSATLQTLGTSKKEIEDKLPKQFEGEYRDGFRHGQFVYWDEQDRSYVVDFGLHGQAPPRAATSTAAWDEASLKELERKADEFAEDNPGVSAYSERFQWRFGYQNAKLHGPFVAWRSVDAEAIKSLGTDRKEIEERLPKLFAGAYEGGRRHGPFLYWNEQGETTEVQYQHGVVQI